MAGSVVRNNKSSRWSVERGSGVSPCILTDMNFYVLKGTGLPTLIKALERLSTEWEGRKVIGLHQTRYA